MRIARPRALALARCRSSASASVVLSEDPVVLQLESELRNPQEYLQASVEELETANEELKSSNEELLSMNEELQSTNEELEQRVFSSSFTPVYEEDGSVVKLIGCTFVISDLKRVAEALERANKELEAQLKGTD